MSTTKFITDENNNLMVDKNGRPLSVELESSEIGIAENGIPTGGTAGQILKKVDDTDYNAEWADLDESGKLPEGGTAGQVLTKVDESNYNAEWKDIPESGTDEYADLNGKPKLNTSNTTAQTTSEAEEINGTVNLHKVSKTGSYNDLNDKPTIPEKTSEIKNDSNFYAKPTDGIPETDLSTAVTQKLNREIPTALSQLQNDSGFITNLVTDLVNYYTKTQVDNLISTIPKFAIAVVDTLPTQNISATTVYLLKENEDSGNLYTEYIYVNNAWEVLGSQKVDLTGYATEEWVALQIADFVTSEQLAEVLAVAESAYKKPSEGIPESDLAKGVRDKLDKEYTLPIANPTTLGGVKPATKTAEMTQGVGVDENGGLWTTAGGGGGSDVVANPDDEATEELYKLGVNGKTYAVPATVMTVSDVDDPNAIEIKTIAFGGDKYRFPSGGGGTGGSSITQQVIDISEGITIAALADLFFGENGIVTQNPNAVISTYLQDTVALQIKQLTGGEDIFLYSYSNFSVSQTVIAINVVNIDNASTGILIVSKIGGSITSGYISGGNIVDIDCAQSIIANNSGTGGFVVNIAQSNQSNNGGGYYASCV